MKKMKRQKGMIPEDEFSRLEGVQYTTEEEQRTITNSSSKSEAAGPMETMLSCGHVWW